tara:strand:- start:1344 stop:2246 length:903 start_codon:yes stop_codon:yes gene_type:complete
MNKKRTILLLSIIPFFGIIFYATKVISYKNSSVTEEISSTLVLEDVAALGKLSPEGEIRQLAPPSNEYGIYPRVEVLYVEEGDFVKRGEILADLENRKKLLIKKTNLEKLLEINKQEIALQSKKLNRYNSAFKEKAASEMDVFREQDKLIKLRNQKIELSSQIKILEIDYINSQLKSPIDGVVLSINTREGERPKSKGILEVGASQKMKAIIEVYESDINRIFKGQSVFIVSENGGFDKTLEGIVERISPQVRQRNILSTDPTGDADARIIEVLIELDKDSSEAVSGFAGMKVIAKFKSK